jgi:dUTP pyrophosphatase
MNSLQIKVKRIHDKLKNIPLPAYATKDSSGLDIRAALEEPLILGKNQIKLVPTNISVEIPRGYEIQVRPRSGLAAKHGIGVLNSPGTIDADYRGEIKVILFNFSENDFLIEPGERIAQLVISKIYKAELVEVEKLNSTERGSGGFGHTGTA